MITADERQASDTATFAVWIGFAMMCIGMFMAILDVQVVATSVPTIQKALNTHKIRCMGSSNL
jgi:MFS transporter, DHA2 family, multidrug resistance protein